MNDHIVSMEQTFYSQRKNIEEFLVNGYPDDENIKTVVKFMFRNLVRLANYAVAEDE